MFSYAYTVVSYKIETPRGDPSGKFLMETEILWNYFSRTNLLWFIDNWSKIGISPKDLNIILVYYEDLTSLSFNTWNFLFITVFQFIKLNHIKIFNFSIILNFMNFYHNLVRISDVVIGCTSILSTNQMILSKE